MYNTWPIKELKSELKRRRVSLDGSNAVEIKVMSRTDLIKRLESLDRECGGPDYLKVEEVDNVPIKQIKLPPHECYSNVTSDSKLPPINKIHIQQFLDYSQMKFKTVNLLYQSRYLVNAYSVIFFENTYIKAHCRKSLNTRQYEVDIILNKLGEPVESGCECKSHSEGYHCKVTCKHVAVALLGVEHMVREKIMLTSEGSLGLQHCNVIAKKPAINYANHIIFEPYPLKNFSKVDYNKTIKNLVMNYSHSTIHLKELYILADNSKIKNDLKDEKA